jgi:hypothetical protein
VPPHESNAQQAPDPALSQIFTDRWIHIQQHLEEEYRADSPSSRRIPDAEDLINWAADSKRLSLKQKDFLHKCRRARNAYAHVAFDGYEGPIGFPPKDVLDRLGRVHSSLTNPPKASSGLPRALTCEASTPVREVLCVMRERDFSQIPYHHDQHGWVLVTRAQIAHWVEDSAETDGACLLDTTTPVAHLADRHWPGPVIARRLFTTARLADVVAEIEEAFTTPDHEDGGYPTVLVIEQNSDNTPFIMVPADLPGAYRRLGH